MIVSDSWRGGQEGCGVSSQLGPCLHCMTKSRYELASSSQCASVCLRLSSVGRNDVAPAMLHVANRRPCPVPVWHTALASLFFRKYLDQRNVPCFVQRIVAVTSEVGRGSRLIAVLVISRAPGGYHQHGKAVSCLFYKASIVTMKPVLMHDMLQYCMLGSCARARRGPLLLHARHDGDGVQTPR